MKEKPRLHTQGDLDFGAEAPPQLSDSVPSVGVSRKASGSAEPKKKAPRASGLCPGCNGSLIDNKCPDCAPAGNH